MNEKQSILSIYNAKSFDDLRKNHWDYISAYQALSEDFIREFKDYVDWNYISIYQLLSENFIREFKDYVAWYRISIYRALSEDFAKEFKDYVDWNYISKYQLLSEDFKKEFDITVSDDCWLYKSVAEKITYLKENTEYEIVDDNYVIAYKSTRKNNYSTFNFQYRYFPGNTYTSHCDCNSNNENSFGLSAWTKEAALGHYDRGKLFKVKIPIDKLGTIVHNGKKSRCFELTILEEIEIDVNQSL
jgi:hypothetical protein